jgi:hypothetical protein
MGVSLILERNYRASLFTVVFHRVTLSSLAFISAAVSTVGHAVLTSSIALRAVNSSENA